MTIKVRVRITGIKEILAAFKQMPVEAQNELRDASNDIAQDLAERIRAAGTALGRVDALAARTLKAKRDRVPVITAGSSGPLKGRKVLYGSEFGMTRKSGWYAKVRYFESAGHQFRPHRGASSYWFFKTVEDNEAEVERRYLFAADNIIRRWGEG